MKKLYGGLVLLLASLSLCAQGQRGGPGMGPPPEAFDACKNISIGASCSFNAPHGSVSGHCRNMGGQGSVCVPQQRGGQSSNQQRGSRQKSPKRVTIVSRNPHAKQVTSHIVDTMQGSCFDSSSLIACPKKGEAFYGQDAHYEGAQPSYLDKGDGTVLDNRTGLQWQKAHHQQRLSFSAAKRACGELNLGGYQDWRLPNIKELFSIADFRGATGSRFFIDTAFFDLEVPDSSILKGDRFASTHRVDMMGQTWSSTLYTGKHWGRDTKAAFFFNFLDGRIKQAPIQGKQGLFYRCVRGKEYGASDFQDNGNGTITDRVSQLVWQQVDDGKARNWEQALAYCENLQLAGRDDWRLPNIKELQSLVDYTRHDPALNLDLFQQKDRKGWFWSSTTHGDSSQMAAYICFGKCTSVDGVDVHGAGAQRSDPKAGDPKDWPPMGGQRDEVRIYNYVRCATDALL